MTRRLSCYKGVTGGKEVELTPLSGTIPEVKVGPELASIASLQKYQLTELLFEVVVGQ